MQGKAVEMLDELKDEVDELVEKVQEAFEDTTQHVKTQLSTIKEKSAGKAEEAKKPEGNPLPVE